jgi:SAM-dependent methyltransferase
MVNNSESPFDILASAYDAWFEEEGKLVFDIEVRAFKEVLHMLPQPWLEVGVGSGRFAQSLGIETGIDPSAKLLEIAKKRGITGFSARGEEKFFDVETFGTVFLIVTLCFVDSPLAVLREAHRILERRGKIVLGVVLRDSPWGQFYLSKKKEGHRFYKYATFYSYQEVLEFLKRTGFTVEKVLSTLFQRPNEVIGMESPQEDFYPDAGFTIVVAGKIPVGERTIGERRV